MKRESYFGFIIGMFIIGLGSSIIAAETYQNRDCAPHERFDGNVWTKRMERGIQIAHKERLSVLDREVEITSVRRINPIAWRPLMGFPTLVNQENVDAIIGPLTSSASLASASMIEKAGVPIHYPHGNSPRYYSKPQVLFQDLFFRYISGGCRGKVCHGNISRQTRRLC